MNSKKTGTWQAAHKLCLWWTFIMSGEQLHMKTGPFFKSAGNRIENKSQPLGKNEEKTSGEKIER